MRPLLFTLLLTASVAGSGCGPSSQQVGEQVLIVAPPVLVLSALLQWLVLRWWPRPRRSPPVPTVDTDALQFPGDPYREPAPTRAGAHGPQAPRLGWTGHLVMGAMLTAVAVIALERGDRTEELGLALWLFGCSYATAVLVFTRLALQWAPVHAFVAPQAAAIVLLLGPAAAMALGLVSLEDLVGPLFIELGMGGAVTGGVFVVLMIEVAIRRRLARRSASQA